ncbi:hypothetical protein ACP275_14G024800 [Erythranthe tilingii]
MVAEPWILKIGNQVSTNLKHALYLDGSTKSSNAKPHDRQIIGILSFEVANVMSKILNLHKSLSEHDFLNLKNEILNSDGIKTLISGDPDHLLHLALLEKLDDLNRAAAVVSRLGKKCTVPALQGFEHVYGDIISGAIDVSELGFLVKDMDSTVRKMERYVGSTVTLYREMAAADELEAAAKKLHQNHHHETSRRAFEQKLTWQRQDIKHLKDISLWNQTYDKIVELLCRTVCTVYARIHIVFRNNNSNRDASSMLISRSRIGSSGNLKRPVSNKRRPKPGPEKNGSGLFGPDDFNFACGIGPGRFFMECITLSSSASKVDDDDFDDDGQRSQLSGSFSTVANSSKCDSKDSTFSGSFSRPVSNGVRAPSTSRWAPASTVGGSALPLHYANIIIIIEKLLMYPHLVGEEARDDLYQMLPTSVRKKLKGELRNYVKDLEIYDAPVAHDWRERLGGVLRWLAPLAHNMMRWQSERNFEQRQIVTRTNVLLVQTLYFADRAKTEDAICRLLVGLNYICRYEQQQNALLDCASSFDFEDCVTWQSRIGGSF